MTKTIRVATAMICLSFLLFPMETRSATAIAESIPADGSEVESLLESVEIWSSEVLDPILTQIVVVAPNGARIDDGSLVVDAENPTHLSTAIGSGGSAGHYTIHLLSGDPNTAGERSESVSFDLLGGSGCDNDAQESNAAGCLEAYSAPMMPPAPPLFSMTTCWPSASESFGWMVRAMKSRFPPGGKGTMNLIGRLG